MLKKMMSIVLAGTLCFSMCACGSSSDYSESSVSESADQGMKTISLENENVLAVKEAVNSHYPGDITYGDAFEEFFTDPSWKYFKGSQEGPDDDGDGEPDYTIDDIDVVEFTGGRTYQDVEVTALIQFTLDKVEGTFEAVYLSFNDVPQSTLMLGGLLSTVFESYMEAHNIQSDDSADTDMSTDNADSDNYDSDNYDSSDYTVSSDDYDYEALTYAGSYSGYGGYTINFSAYTSVDSDEIGVAEIYYNGEFESRQNVYLCDDPGDWDPSIYDAFYVIHMDGYDEYLGFYEDDGTIILDYDGNAHNLDTLEMTEHYES